MNFRIVGMAVAVATAGFLGASVSAGPAVALPAYAASTGKPCGTCHVNPAGGGARNAFGEAFAKNGHKLPGKK